jgi:DNA-binding NarL/FixJ family response regulator
MAVDKVSKMIGSSRNGETIRVVLVDEREAMRAGLRHMLSGDEGIAVVGEARDGQEALAQAKNLRPDIVLMDSGVRSGTGIDTARSFKELRLPTSVIILADNRKHLAPAIEAGAVGFLPRNISRSHLAAAIRIIHLWRLGLFNTRNHFALVKL